MRETASTHTHTHSLGCTHGTFGRRNAADSAGKLGIQRVKSSLVLPATHQTRAESEVSLVSTAVVIAQKNRWRLGVKHADERPESSQNGVARSSEQKPKAPFRLARTPCICRPRSTSTHANDSCPWEDLSLFWGNALLQDGEFRFIQLSLHIQATVRVCGTAPNITNYKAETAVFVMCQQENLSFSAGKMLRKTPSC